jgi:uncharacterized repeat protein (TIGR03847 family)
VSRSFELPEAEWATVGAVGEPGQRTFYMQARQDEQLLTLKLEKQQVAAIAQFLAEILADLPSPADKDVVVAADLVEPVLAEWPVGSLQLSYDSVIDRIVILAEELTDEDDEDDDDESDRAVARIGITRATAAVIVNIGVDLIGAGRPICALCGRPMDPEGHSCPRTNGHKPH